MPVMISAKQLRERLQDVVEKVRHGERFTVLYRSRPAFDIVPLNNPAIKNAPLESSSGRDGAPAAIRSFRFAPDLTSR